MNKIGVGKLFDRTAMKKNLISFKLQVECYDGG